jgi:prophage regulatory protein
MSSRILRLREVRERTGLATSSLYSLISQGRFPRPVQLSERSVGWPENEVEDFVTARITERDAAILDMLGTKEPTTDAERGAVARELIRKVAQSKTEW